MYCAPLKSVRVWVEEKVASLNAVLNVYRIIVHKNNLQWLDHACTAGSCLVSNKNVDRSQRDNQKPTLPNPLLTFIGITYLDLLAEGWLLNLHFCYIALQGKETIATCLETRSPTSIS